MRLYRAALRHCKSTEGGVDRLVIQSQPRPVCVCVLFVLFCSTKEIQIGILPRKQSEVLYQRVANNRKELSYDNDESISGQI